MADTPLLRAQTQNARLPHVQTIGQILMRLADMSERAAQLIEQDLENKKMSLEACGEALKAYAREHQQGGCWACAVFGLTPDNPALKVIMDFYKIPNAWVFGDGVDAPSVTRGDIPLEEGDLERRNSETGVIDLMDLL